MILRSGREVSRIEGFSDAVFGFALTLLVVSLEVPPDFDALKQTLRGFLPFALTFALISWIWFVHYAFFRQFGLEDRLTIFLNSVLLFVVLFFVYPLKVIANSLVGFGQGTGLIMSESDGRMLMWLYSAGFVAMMPVFWLLELEASIATARRSGCRPSRPLRPRPDAQTHASSVLLGLTSVILALTLADERGSVSPA